MITTSEIRNQFLQYFKDKGHEIVDSSSLVPGNDKTLLFTNAGMVQFKDVFTGAETRRYKRATTSQRCVRAGGKHNDLDNVGYTARHHTFFEMLGNFSFGDYFKEDAIVYAWEFLTDVIGLPPEKLWVTVFEEDDEAMDLWVNKIGVPKERVKRIGAKDNFWMMGDTGPCGPCSEIFYDHGEEVWGGPPGSPDEDGDRYIEIWNLVFMQFDRAADGTMTPLPLPSVDTGMGLERLAAVLQHVHSNYEIDLFQYLIKQSADVIGCTDLDNASLRVIADHIRSCAFLVADGVLPSNEGRGYVLRRIIRRAARHGNKLGAAEPFFYKLVAPLIEAMGEAYPILVSAREKLENELLKEEERFSTTLASGMKILEESISNLTANEIPGDVVFKLYDTYGFPLDLTEDIARERQLTVDKTGFEAAMNQQRERARAASSFAVTAQANLGSDLQTRFLGYTSLGADAVLTGLFQQGEMVKQLDAGSEGILVLDGTPFYGESGGQIGDTGLISHSGMQFRVSDTQKQGQAFLHYGKVESGTATLGDQVRADVDSARRQAVVLNHSATHLLHGALREVLGSHVQQKGSLVADSHLRFDFSHGEPVKPEQLTVIERWVNDQIRLNNATEIKEMTLDEAMDAGAMALFGEKYGERVRVVSIGDESIELCGGTHVTASGDIGSFRINLETGVAAGVRRIEALTGPHALQAIEQEHTTVLGLAQALKTKPEDVAEKVASLQERNRELVRELERVQSKLSSSASLELAEQAIEIDDVKVLVYQVEQADVKTLRNMMDQLKQKLGSAAIVLASEHKGKAVLIAGVTAPLNKRIKAGELVNVVATELGGKGGGRPDMAQAGAESLNGVEAAFAKVEPWVRARMTE